MVASSTTLSTLPPRTPEMLSLRLFAVISLLTLSLQAATVSAEETVRFNRSVRPIFTKHCTACHGGVKQAAEISFSYRDQVLPPDGWIVEPGDPDASLLIERVVSDDPEERMPPPEHGEKLSKDEIDVLKRWIRQGASWSEHWAYELPIAPETPQVNDADWCRQSLDRFIVAKLQQKGIRPAPDERPERWLRRVTLDLTGLPPTLDERQRFLDSLRQGREQAYRSVVDSLLKSPAFGERWASVWLDQVRYADSKGLGLDGRRNIWKYRDWVIDSLNHDLPFDQFTVKQIAGDLLPNPTMEDRIATAAHRTTQTNEEGGTDDEEFRVAAVLDRVNTTWQTWQGVTFGCVQCHSHPYDPFKHEEYYRFAAFFNNTRDSDLNEDWPTVQVPIDTADYPRAANLDKQLETLRRTLWEREYAALSDTELWKPLSAMKASTNNATKVGVESKGRHDQFHTIDTVTKNVDITLESPIPAGLEKLTAIRLTGMPLEPEKAESDSEWGFVISHIQAELVLPDEKEPVPLEFSRVISDEPNPFYDPEQSLNAKSNQGFAAYTRINYPRSAAFILKSAKSVTKGTRLRVTLKHRQFLLASFALVMRRGQLDVTDDERLTEIASGDEATQIRTEMDDLRSRRSKIKSTSVPVMAEREPHLARKSHVFVRGLFLTKDNEVTPGTPDSLPPLPSDRPADRLALANWIVSPENPLTARVTVNRIWSRLFGVGIVATEEDFGSSGDPPSHPQLLDHLAVRFQSELGWSTKALIREIVLSRTYRQSSAIRKELLESDPGNRLLARGPRHRLSAEIVRDQALAISGLLGESMHGPPVHPPIPDGVWKPFTAGDKWKTPDINDPDRYRRSVYTYTKRSIPFPMFSSFDAPSREFCSPRRLRSNTPLQALMTLNDQTFAECAAAFGKRMSQSGNSPAEILRSGFLMSTCREPSEREIDDLIGLYESLEDLENQQRLSIIASVLLNLDEVLTK